MSKWLRDADFFHKREEERAENRRTQPTRPALICSRCGQELPSQWTWETPLADKYFLVEENGAFVRHHRSCGGRVDWVEVTSPYPKIRR